MTLHNSKVVSCCEPDIASKSVQMQTFNCGLFRELLAYVLTEFYCTTYSVGMLPKGLAANQVEMIKNLVAYFNAHKKSILTIECLPDRLKKMMMKKLQNHQMQIHRTLNIPQWIQMEE